MIELFPVLRIHVHDFSAHPFQEELSNEFARLGHEVTHSFFDQPGQKKTELQDKYRSSRIKFVGIRLRQRYQIESVVKRLIFEVAFAAKLIHLQWKYRPDITLMANSPLISATLFRVFNPRCTFIFWHQDVMTMALETKFSNENRKDKVRYKFLTSSVRFLEKTLLKTSSHVIGISDAFGQLYKSWNLDPKKYSVIENWAPLDEFGKSGSLPNLESGLSLIYAGTIGMKHHPELMIDLVERLLLQFKKVDLLIVSQGEKVEALKSKVKGRLPVRFSNYLPTSELNENLSRSHIALMILEPDASKFSVPSKTYSYLAAGKFIVAFAPQSNAASNAITSAGGFVFSPNDEGVALAAAKISKLNDGGLLELGERARAYAEEEFEIQKKASLFLNILLNSFMKA